MAHPVVHPHRVRLSVTEDEPPQFVRGQKLIDLGVLARQPYVDPADIAVDRLVACCRPRGVEDTADLELSEHRRTSLLLVLYPFHLNIDRRLSRAFSGGGGGDRGGFAYGTPPFSGAGGRGWLQRSGNGLGGVYSKRRRCGVVAGAGAVAKDVSGSFVLVAVAALGGRVGAAAGMLAGVL